jgi:hypothetical protein
MNKKSVRQGEIIIAIFCGVSFCASPLLFCKSCYYHSFNSKRWYNSISSIKVSPLTPLALMANTGLTGVLDFKRMIQCDARSLWLYVELAIFYSLNDVGFL